MRKRRLKKTATAVIAWLAACVMFFPVFWMLLSGFKTEVEAIATPPELFFKPTLENFIAVQQRAGYAKYALNSVVVSLGSTVLALAFAIPAAYAMAFFPTRRTRDT